MTKQDILNILYSERQRIKDISNKPGWSIWAIIGSISVCIWFLIELIFNNSINWIYTIPIAFVLFNVLLTLSTIVLNTRKRKDNNRYKSFNEILSKESIIQLILICVILCIELIFLIINSHLWSKTCWLLYIAKIGLSTYILNIAIALVIYFIKIPNQKKQNKKVTKLIILVYAIFWVGIITVFIYPVIGNSVTQLEIKTSILISVIYILFVQLPFAGNSNKSVSCIDDLIDCVLFEPNVEEAKIFKELEVIELGLKLPEYMQETLSILQFYSQLLYNRDNELHELEKQLNSPSKIEEKIKLAEIMRKKASESLSMGKKSLKAQQNILGIIQSYYEDPLFSELLQKTKCFADELNGNINKCLSSIDNIYNTIVDFISQVELLVKGELIDGETKCQFCRKYSIIWDNKI